MNAHVQAARLLIEHSRYDRAEQELRLGLAQDPNDPAAFALLALCLAEGKRLKPATDAAHRAIQLAPTDAFPHYAFAYVLNERSRPKEAEIPAREAIRLDPDDADYHGMLAAIIAQQERWQDALVVAERGLQIDPEHVVCINARALALAHLGRRTEAIETTRWALASDPENAVTHANHGWMLLRHEKPQDAMTHFREALRLDPTCDWARQGIVEALKARHRVYRWLLRYAFWMSTLSNRARWGVIIGLYFIYQIARRTARSNPDAAPFLWPVIGLYLAFVLLTWVGQPMFNLLLRLNRFGRLALSDEQRRESNWVGLCMLGVPIFVAAALITGITDLYLGALACWLLVLPVAGIFKCHAGWPRTAMALYAGATALFAAIGLVVFVVVDRSAVTISGESRNIGQAIFTTCMLVCILLAAVSSWLVNIMAGIRPKK